MAKPTSQHDFGPQLLAKLQEGLPAALPLLEMLTAIGRALKTAEDAASNSPRRKASKGSQISEEVSAGIQELLREDIKAESKPEKSFNPYFGTSKSIEKRRRRNVFEQFERYEDKFRAKQWEVVVLFYKEEMSEEEIGRKIGICRTAVCNRLKRARDRKDALDKESRYEAYEQLRKQKKDDV
jgi:predicted DNA-binding protein YlxM (UPF0122 family)